MAVLNCEDLYLEKVFNVFLYYQNGLIDEVGYVCHEISASDSEIEQFLQKEIERDHIKSSKIKLSPAVTHENFMAMCRLGTHLSLFEKFFAKEGASATPLVLLTPIVEGKPQFDIQVSHEPFSYSDIPGHLQSYPGIMPDYLIEYMTDEGFNIPQLINDDYFEAIRVLFNQKHYVSSAKLLLSCLDSLAFIEFGDLPKTNVLKKWLETYADLTKHNVTAEEIVELRHSLLHMTNLDSRAVKSNKTKRVIIYVGNIEERKHPKAQEDVKFLNLRTFITTIGNAISKWLLTYNLEPTKMVGFIERYDLTISDKRLAYIEIAKE